MRMRVSWMANPPLVLPIGYHQIMQGVIYHAMRNQTGYSDFVHDEGYAYGQRRFRMFCFSHLMGEAHRREKELVFTGSVSFEVTSPDVYLIRTVEENIRKNGLVFGTQRYQNVQVMLSNMEIESDEMIVKAISPITVYTTDAVSGKTKYFFPREREFEMAVNDNFQRKYLAYYGVAASSMVSISPVELKKNDKCVTSYKGIYITGYSGTYRIEAPRKYLDFLYQTGVGAKNSQGFGMVSLSR